MRKPRNFDAELKALDDKTRSLRQRKLEHLGELVMATGADALDAEVLAGGLLAMVEAQNAAGKESWRNRGQAFFRGRSRRAARKAGGDPPSEPTRDAATPPPGSEPSA